MQTDATDRASGTSESEETMTERPIIFSADSVRKILAGTKTQTRRPVKNLRWVADPAPGVEPYWFFPDHPRSEHSGGGPITSKHWTMCPYGFPGESRLWVRETFMFAKGADVRESYIGTDMEPLLGPKPWYVYRSTEPDSGGGVFKWRPSIFMPHHASRLTLEITDIRVERLQDISEEDAKAEGAGVIPSTMYADEPLDEHPYRNGFMALWDSINGKSYSWSDNPWVWVIAFKRVD